jgi:hypothetical protein
MPVIRQAVIAPSFGLRFQGQAYFLTDARASQHQWYGDRTARS